LSVDKVSVSSVVDEIAMEELLREIIAPSNSPSSPAASLPVETIPPAAQTATDASTSTVISDWEKEVEMQRFLDTITGVQPEMEEIDFSSALDLELGGWELPTSEIGVF
jgi:hypothetical protein